MKITAHGATGVPASYPGEAFGVQGTWIGTGRQGPVALTGMVLDLGRRVDGEGTDAVTRSAPQIIVLTHDDADHIGGAPSALAAWPAVVPGLPRQVWMPAEWWYVLQAWMSLPGADTPSVDVGSSLPTVDQLEKSIINDRLDVEFATDARAIASRILVSARRILPTVLAAMAVSQVRWFVFTETGASPWRTEGLPGAITLVNAREVFPTASGSPGSLRTLYLLAQLTVQNRRALVTFVWPECDCFLVGRHHTARVCCRAGFLH